MAVTDPAPTIWAKVQQIATSIESHFAGFMTKAKAALGWAADEVPKMQQVVNTFVAATAVVFPEAAAANAFMLTVEKAVAWVDDMIKTSEGVVMKTSEAANIGATVAGPASFDDKKLAAQTQIVDLHPDVPLSLVNAHIEAAVVNKNASQSAS